MQWKKLWFVALYWCWVMLVPSPKHHMWPCLLVFNCLQCQKFICWCINTDIIFHFKQSICFVCFKFHVIKQILLVFFFHLGVMANKEVHLSLISIYNSSYIVFLVKSCKYLNVRMHLWCFEILEKRFYNWFIMR